MITIAEAQVAAGRTVKGRVVSDEDIDVGWLIWRLEHVTRGVMGEGGKPINDYTLIEKRALLRGPSDAGFEFHVPVAGPLSYEGKLIRIVWEIGVGSESSSAAKVAEYARFKVVAG